jgi:TolB-like protein/DNA-binding winged helix-turn-helix (wHTH) protein
MDLLILLVERQGELVSRDEIAGRLWGQDVFVDIEHGINTAVRKVRMALRDDPEKPRFIETVVGKGYRFAVPVTCGNGAAPVAESEEPQSAPSVISNTAAGAVAQQKAQKDRKSLLIAAGVVLILAVAVGLSLRYRSARPPAASRIRSLAVLPLKNLSGDPSQEYVADGLTEALIGRLSAIHDLRVISRTSVMRFKDAQLSIPEIAKTLQADAVVEGSVVREGNRIRVTAQLIRGPSDEHFWSETYDRELPDVLSLESDVAQAIAQKVEVTITGEEKLRITASHSVLPEAYENYLKGRSLLHNSNSRAETEKSIRYFEEAIRKDPAFAPAYVGLGLAHDALGTVVMGGGGS